MFSRFSCCFKVRIEIEEEPVFIDDPRWLKRLKRNINNDHTDDDPMSTLEKDVRKKLCDGESPRSLLKNIEKLIGHN